MPLETPDLIKTAHLGGMQVDACLSRQAEDPLWDSFLRASHLGQFQQSSMWSRVKALENWSCIRVVLKHGDEIVGGFQLLRKKMGPIAIGYISKGPVLKLDNFLMVEFSIQLISAIARKFRISAIIVQVPDRCNYGQFFLQSPLFLPNRILGVIENTLIVDVGREIKEVERDLSRETRRMIRKAEQMGIRIREGDASDAESFFNLMLSSCRRQQQKKPNPPNVESLRRLMETFHSQGCVRLTLAEYSGMAIAGQLSILFGETVNLFKKGWSPQHNDLRPNELLFWDALRWSQQQGYRFCDFGSLQPDIAAALLQKRELNAKQKQSRDVFNIRFGGRPLALPHSAVFIANHALRLAYHTALLIRKC
jgi:lipid II:glycine glycyltransferase (peptidoglycan interpeptide bridge formation enzyme)